MDLLHGWQQQADQDADDRDDHQQAERLRLMILDGDLKPGERLRQAYLAQKFGVSIHGTWHSPRSIRRSGVTSAGSGTLTTVPVRFSGSRLEINAATQPGGQIVVELLDAAGRPLDGLPPSEPFTGDDLRHRVRFKGHDDVSALAGKPVVLRFRMRSASLSSFAFRAPEKPAALPGVRGH